MPSSQQQNIFFHLTLLCLFTLLLYVGILHNSWHLDDTGNILHNPPLHITNFHPDTLFKTFYAHPESTGKLYRPVANFTFALNWFFGQDSPVGYHLVNIFIHALTAVMLYLSCCLLFNTPALKKQSSSKTRKTDIALLAAALWMTAPIHTSAVTYIVQRMAQLAALFSISAIFFYLRARLTENRVQQAALSLCFLCCALLALGSKENAVLLFPSIVLTEGIFFFRFQQLLLFAKKKRKSFTVLSFLLVSGIFFVSWDFIAAQINSYGHRNFTFSERILTEPRIILFYLSQIFYPTASRLSIAHDITLSTSLFSPWQTLPAIVSCLGLIALALFQVNKRPLFAFAILYYFLNHLVESTFLNLELIFEHRNLLPSLFLFLPISAFTIEIINRKKWVAPVLAVCCTTFLFQSSLAVVERNKVWENAGTLNQDTVLKAPHDARAKLNLADWYIGQKKYEEALLLCQQAEQLSGREASVNTTVPIALNLRGTIAYEQGKPGKAAEYFQQAYSLRKDYTAIAEKFIAILVELEHYDEALTVLDERYKQKEDPKLLLLKASVFLRQNKAAKSLAAYQQARQFYPTLPLIVAGEAKALMIMGDYERAMILLDKAVQQNEPVAKLLQIENSLLGGADQQAAALLNRLVQTVPLVRLLNELDAAKKDTFQIPVDKKMLQHAVLNAAALVLPVEMKEKNE